MGYYMNGHCTMGDAGPHQSYDPSYDYDTSSIHEIDIVSYGFVPNIFFYIINI